MAIRKRNTKHGISWGFYFDSPTSTREHRVTITRWGFATRREAVEAEAQRRIEEAQPKPQGATAIPKTLASLLNEFLETYAEQNLAKRTVENYRKAIPYIAPELMAMPLTEIKPLHLTREWNRLRESGGRNRFTGEVRPLKSATVGTVIWLVSAAYREAVAWGLAESNPVDYSRKPQGGDQKRIVALSPAQQRLLIDAAPASLMVILEACAGLGARRGEVLALRWADIHGDEAMIGRSLFSTKAGGLEFKTPKTQAGYRTVTVPQSTLAVLKKHRVKQEEFRQQYGSDYRADLDLIFCQPDGKPLNPDVISTRVSELFRRLKLPKGAALHALRHTHGSQLLSAGMELPAVSARLGHSNPAVTARIYSHLLPGRDRAASEVWEALQTKPEVESKEKVQ